MQHIVLVLFVAHLARVLNKELQVQLEMRQTTDWSNVVFEERLIKVNKYS